MDFPRPQPARRSVPQRSTCGGLSSPALGERLGSLFDFPRGLGDGVALEEPWRTPSGAQHRGAVAAQKPPRSFPLSFRFGFFGFAAGFDVCGVMAGGEQLANG